mgnify:CR=1 FL=1
MVEHNSDMDAIRTCPWSALPCNATDLLPDYKCRKNGAPCALLTHPTCDRREQFPESHDH